MGPGGTAYQTRSVCGTYQLQWWTTPGGEGPYFLYRARRVVDDLSGWELIAKRTTRAGALLAAQQDTDIKASMITSSLTPQTPH